ncbi:MAG: 1-phosphofructokinase family hexose kinase [Armatimonadota bacterium]|nr:1-phosphofructokinase family hexose kinase [Armatimonadota bacterium]
MITVLCANAGVDKTYEVPNFAAGGYYHPSAASTVAGGKGINVARVLKVLGQSHLVMGFAGGGNGRFINRYLIDEGFNTDFVQVAEESRVTINIIDQAQGTQTRVDELGPLVTPSEVRRLHSTWRRHIQRASLAVIAGSAPRGVNLEVYAELVEAAHQREVPVIVDARDELLARAVPARPTVMAPNLGELQRLVERQLSVPDGVLEAATELVDEGIRVVLVTLGARGAIAVTRSGGVWSARPPEIERLSSVGSGDALVAGFAAASVQRKPFGERLRLGVACGAANAETFGACNVTVERIRELLPEVEIERLDAAEGEDDAKQ